MMKFVKIHTHEKGLLFKDREFKGIIGPGRHFLFDPLGNIRVDAVSERDPWLIHRELDVIVRSGALEGNATVLDLKDKERGLVWIDGRFDRIIGPGLSALWTAFREISVEKFDIHAVRFQHPDLNIILKSPNAELFLETHVVEEGFVALLFRDGEYIQNYGPGKYSFWKNGGKTRLVQVDTRETVLDISGQELMTADKVTLRMNALVAYKVNDPRMALCSVENYSQGLYREAQLALREVVAASDLDRLLAEKEHLTRELEVIIRRRVTPFGLQVQTFGIRDVILPGEMKDLLNKVIEARKAAEANLIVRREETAAMRSQANTAKLLENNPTLMRLRELEVLERIAGSSQLKVVLGEKGLADRIVNLL